MSPCSRGAIYLYVAEHFRTKCWAGSRWEGFFCGCERQSISCSRRKAPLLDSFLFIFPKQKAEEGESCLPAGSCASQSALSRVWFVKASKSTGLQEEFHSDQALDATIRPQGLKNEMK